MTVVYETRDECTYVGENLIPWNFTWPNRFKLKEKIENNYSILISV